MDTNNYDMYLGKQGGEVCWRGEAADIDLPGTRESPFYNETFTSVGAGLGLGVPHRFLQPCDWISLGVIVRVQHHRMLT